MWEQWLQEQVIRVEFMITDMQRQFILASAIVPEHLVDLMTLVSGGEAHLIEEHLCVTGPQCLIVVGYPLGAEYEGTTFGSKVEGILVRFRPKQAWIVAPHLPLSLKNRAAELESDCYYRLDLCAEILG